MEYNAGVGRTSRCRQFWDYLKEPVQVDLLAQSELVLLTHCTGCQDAAVAATYRCFASNQTGNTVMLAISIAGMYHEQGARTANIGASLGVFLFGAWCIGQLGHIVGPRRRVWLTFSNALQTILVSAAAALIYISEMVGEEGRSSIAVIALLAFASGAQVVMSRAFTCNEISAGPATAACVNLMMDQKLFSGNNRPRNRRVSFHAALISGAVAGAFMYQRLGLALVILVSAVLKAVVTSMLAFNQAQLPEKENVQLT